jgi:hypothetical protein
LEPPCEIIHFLVPRFACSPLRARAVNGKALCTTQVRACCRHRNYASRRDSRGAPGAFCTHFYFYVDIHDHTRRLRLEKPLHLELSKS